MNKATRGDGLHLVPSQQTERIQASNELKPYTEKSIIEKLSDWWGYKRFDKLFWLYALALIYLSIVIGGLIVTLSGCAVVGGCNHGETRCKGNVVEQCHELTGWERQEVCSGTEVCHFDKPAFCGTYDIACCAPVLR